MTLLFILFLIPMSTLFAQQTVIDFGNSTGGQNWYVTNDGVMGGLSKGRAILSDSSVFFNGVVSLENNGGFSSLRSPYQRFNLSKFEEVVIRARSSGLPFSITFSKSQRFYIPNYKHMLALDSEKWTLVSFKLEDLKEYRLGNPTGRSITETDIKNLIGISFFNEGKLEGNFSLEIDYILFK